MPCRLSKTTLLFVKNYLLNRVSYAFSSRKLSFLNEKAIFSQRESIADSTKNMAFLNKKGVHPQFCWMKMKDKGSRCKNRIFAVEQKNKKR